MIDISEWFINLCELSTLYGCLLMCDNIVLDVIININYCTDILFSDYIHLGFLLSVYQLCYYTNWLYELL